MPTLRTRQPWAPHPSAAPRTEDVGDALLTAANGTRTCVGGWQLRYDGALPGRAYEIAVRAEGQGLDHPRDALQAVVHWEELPADRPRTSGDWAYLMPRVEGDGGIVFAAVVVTPPSATALTVRLTFRWSTTGSARWSLPEVREVAVPQMRPPVRVAVVTGDVYSRRGPHTVASNVAFYRALCALAAEESPDLMLLPEVCLQWEIAEGALDAALPLDSDEVGVFCDLAREAGCYLGLGLFQREGDAVFNTLALIDPAGQIAAKYHKVHLAVLNESDSGVRPGDRFDVADTPLGRIGFNICMDTSAAESSRMVGLHGAEMLLMPIMGDHRADRWSPGPPYYNADRWRAIMRAHAMDNQLCMVVARNRAHGSCVIDRKGDILAWNEGTADYVVADVRLDDGYRTWNGGCFREITWAQRRPHLYGAFVDEGNVGPWG